MEIIKPKRVVGVKHNPTKFFTITLYTEEGMQEFLCSDCKDIYHSQQERRRERFREQELAFKNRLAADSEEQLRYNNLINSITDYKDYNEYKYKNSFKYKILKRLKLTKLWQ
jgi:hypothetical protein